MIYHIVTRSGLATKYKDITDHRDAVALITLVFFLLLSGCTLYPPILSQKQVVIDTALFETNPDMIPEKTDTEVKPEIIVESGAEKNSLPLRLTLNEAILSALENNAAFQIDRIDPRITATEEQVRRSVFDPIISASVEAGVTRDSSDDGATDTGTDSDNVSATIGIEDFLPYGTTLSLSAGPQFSFTDNGTKKDVRELGWDLSVNQPLLRGMGTSVNLARLRQARLDTEISVYELKAAAENLVSQTEQTFWEYVLAQRSIAIYEKSLEVADQQLDEVRERIRVGKLAENEMAAVEAERANRLEQLINARAELLKKQLTLIRLLNSGTGNDMWERKIEILDVPEIQPIQLETIHTYIRSAMKNRPDLNQSRLEIKKGNLEIVRTKNGLLPKLDLFIRLGGSHYSNSFSGRDMDGDAITLTSGIDFEFPYKNRQAKALHDRAQFSLEQSRLALNNLEQLVQVDVRSAYVDVKRNEEQINATRATRIAREKTLNIEQEKFRVGKSTAFIVAQAQRDLVAGRIAEIEAVIEYRKALMSLYRLDGSLLNRRGIETFDK